MKKLIKTHVFTCNTCGRPVSYRKMEEQVERMSWGHIWCDWCEAIRDWGLTEAWVQAGSFNKETDHGEVHPE